MMTAEEGVSRSSATASRRLQPLRHGPHPQQEQQQDTFSSHATGTPVSGTGTQVRVLYEHAKLILEVGT